MNVSKRSDQVFQLSLTEIAFTIAFILLLLLGYLVSRESEAKKKAEEALAKVQELGAAQQAFDEASRRLKEGLGGAGSTNPDEIVSRLVVEAGAAAERDRLLVRVKDLEAQVSALSEVKQIAAEAGKTAVVDRIVTALAMQSEAENVILKAKEDASSIGKKPATANGREQKVVAQEQLSGSQRVTATKLPSPEETRAEVRRSIQVMAAVDMALKETQADQLPEGKEAATVADMVRTAQSLRVLESAGKGVEAVLKENTDLRGQMANMRNKFNAVGRGLDHPPCWADEAGNIEYLFKVELRQGAVVVAPAWPDRRRLDAEQLPGVTELIAGPVSSERFRALSQPILDISKRQDPECRHFVVIFNTIEMRRDADQARWMVEKYFYKRETSR